MSHQKIKKVRDLTVKSYQPLVFLDLSLGFYFELHFGHKGEALYFLKF